MFLRRTKDCRSLAHRQKMVYKGKRDPTDDLWAVDQKGIRTPAGTKGLLV